MNRILPGVAALLLSTVVSAQIYQWKDDKGKTVISDKPPASAAREQRRIDSETPTADPAQKTTADRELEFRKRQKDAQESAEKTRKEQTLLAARKENCASARRQLQVLESGDRIAMRDDKGERYYLDDAARQQEIQAARKAASANCQ